MITKEQAEHLVSKHIGSWKDLPELIITKVTEHPLGWVISYDSRLFRETGEMQHAIAGNAPFLVSRVDGTMFPTGTAPPFEERLREAERKLTAHLQSKI